MSRAKDLALRTWGSYKLGTSSPEGVSEQVSWPEALVVAAAATAANLLESFLGAMVQGRVDWLSNDVINMIQIVVAAALAIAGNYALLQ